MLKFESWPPEPGSVQWTELAHDTLRNRHQVFSDFAFGEGFAKHEGTLTEIANFSGHLIMSNLPEDSEGTAFKIAVELTDGWTVNAKDLFVYQFGYGAGLNREQIEAQLVED